VEAIRVADRVGLLAALEGGVAGTGPELARRLGLHERATGELLDLLSVLGFVHSERGRFERTQTKLDPWPRLETYVRSGEVLTCIDETAERGPTYAEVVDVLAERFREPALELAAALDSAGSVLDVGAGSGVWSLAMASRCQETRVLALDLPAVLPRFSRRAASLGLADRCDVVEGDYFAVSLGERRFDRVVLANVLHLESPERAAMLVRRFAESVAPGGELVVVDCVSRGELGEELARTAYSLHLGMRTSVGGVHAPPCVRRWCSEAGLTETSILSLKSAPVMGAIRATRARTA